MPRCLVVEIAPTTALRVVEVAGTDTLRCIAATIVHFPRPGTLFDGHIACAFVKALLVVSSTRRFAFLADSSKQATLDSLSFHNYLWPLLESAESRNDLLLPAELPQVHLSSNFVLRRITDIIRLFVSYPPMPLQLAIIASKHPLLLGIGPVASYGATKTSFKQERHILSISAERHRAESFQEKAKDLPLAAYVTGFDSTD